jgi:hypothetical protein
LRFRPTAAVILLAALSSGCPLAVSDDYEIGSGKAIGESCAGAAECASGVCTAKKCAAPTCTDGVDNGGETDVDCGGGSCPKCPDNRACAAPSDCVSGNCQGSTCQPK